MVISGVAKSSTSFSWGKGRNVTSAGWQVTLCDPIWHVSSRSGEAGCNSLQTAILCLLYLLTSVCVDHNHNNSKSVRLSDSSGHSAINIGGHSV